MAEAVSGYYIETKNEAMKEYGMEFFPTVVPARTTAAAAHIHDAIEIAFLQEGKYNIFVNGEEFLAGEGDVLLFRSNAIHRIYTMDSPVNRYYVLKVMPSVFFELAAKEHAVNYVLKFSLSGSQEKVHWRVQELEGSPLQEAFLRLVEEAGRQGVCEDISLKICSYQVILCVLRELMEREGKTGKTKGAKDSTAAQIYESIRFMNKNFGEEIDAEDLSRRVNMSYSYFSRCFKRVVGKNFKEYLNEIRINHAQQLLVTTDLSVTQVALECGYNNVSYFIAVYRAKMGRTPLLERKIEEEHQFGE